MSSLHRLVYTSFRKPNCDEKEIQNILESCKKNNPQRDITGILLHSDKRFIQYIEGQKDDVLELYNLIKDDDRHTSVNQRNLEPINKRIFPSWEMGYKDVDKIEFDTEASAQDQKTFNMLIKDELDFDDNALRILQLFFKMA
ncbi:BLUF domain-containing protein [Ekhidna sp. To15]|uniref:BLUF domain-containing protein n=1 Tax=Ekhidna sp. To15 TaxID=3395267 RepID=UPI003F522960